VISLASLSHGPDRLAAGGWKPKEERRNRVSQAIEAVMRRFVAEVMNEGNLAVVDETVHPKLHLPQP
jgi:hypothetical protein